VRLILAESDFTFENKILNMKSFFHELDLKFQKTAIITAVLATLVIIVLNKTDAVVIPLQQVHSLLQGWRHWLP
jgi:hypothetical protein